MKKVLLMLVIIVAAVGAYFGIDYQQKHDEKTIRIGVTLPMTGDSKEYGDVAKIVIDTYFEEFASNDNFFKYKIVYKDNAYDTVDNIKATEKLIESENVDWMVSVVADIDKDTHSIMSKEMFYSIVAIEPNAREESNNIYNALVGNKIAKVDILTIDFENAIKSREYIKNRIEASEDITIGSERNVNLSTTTMEDVLEDTKNSDAGAVIVFASIDALKAMVEPYEKMEIKVPFLALQTPLYVQDGGLEKDLKESLGVMTNAFETEKNKDIRAFFQRQIEMQQEQAEVEE